MIRVLVGTVVASIVGAILGWASFVLFGLSYPGSDGTDMGWLFVEVGALIGLLAGALLAWRKKQLLAPLGFSALGLLIGFYLGFWVAKFVERTYWLKGSGDDEQQAVFFLALQIAWIVLGIPLAFFGYRLGKYFRDKDWTTTPLPRKGDLR